MARIKYYYDTETCKYERVKVTTWDVTLNLLGFLAVAVIIGILMVLVYFRYFESPKEALQRKEIEEYKLHHAIMDKEIEYMSQMVAALQERDDDIYRTIFEAEPIPSSVRSAGVGGSNRYKELLESGLEQEEMIVGSFKKIDKLKKQMYIQTKSYDEIMEMAMNRDKMLASIPAIQPVANKELKRLASGFGVRYHPIYKVRKMHWGCDFSAPRGTPIYATGDGTVIKVKSSNKAAGYGNMVKIDHGYGYETLYAHMQSFNVKQGQKVKRGEVIGYVGNSGGSTAPHCHYEIVKDGKKVNPVKYFLQDLTDEEYDKLLELASRNNQSLG